MQKKFWFLRFVAGVVRFIGILTILAGIVVAVLPFVWNLIGRADYPYGYQYGMYMMGPFQGLALIISGVLLCGFGEIPYVLLAIEENTRKAPPPVLPK
ncbi:MAG TPA: hypothetical protein PKD55_12505 [Bellilinea sp.]|nr:hypothetical protein [Bellilinea sp.]